MHRLRPFLIAAEESGFVHVRECHNGTVLWLNRHTPDASSQAHPRICMDSLTVSATAYWTDSQGNPASKSFRKPLALKEWLAMESAR